MAGIGELVQCSPGKNILQGDGTVVAVEMVVGAADHDDRGGDGPNVLAGVPGVVDPHGHVLRDQPLEVGLWVRLGIGASEYGPPGLRSRHDCGVTCELNARLASGSCQFEPMVNSVPTRSG